MPDAQAGMRPISSLHEVAVAAQIVQQRELPLLSLAVSGLVAMYPIMPTW